MSYKNEVENLMFVAQVVFNYNIFWALLTYIEGLPGRGGKGVLGSPGRTWVRFPARKSKNLTNEISTSGGAHGPEVHSAYTKNEYQVNSWEQRRPGVELTTLPHQVPRLRIVEAFTFHPSKGLHGLYGDSFALLCFALVCFAMSLFQSADELVVDSLRTLHSQKFFI